MIRFNSAVLISVLSTVIKAFMDFLSRFVSRSKENASNFSANHSHVASTNSPVFLPGGVSGNDEISSDRRGRNFDEINDNCNKYEFMSGKDVCGFFEKPKMEEFVAREMFVGSNEVVESYDADQSLDCEVSGDLSRQSLLEINEEESDSCLFRFKLFDASNEALIPGRTNSVDFVIVRNKDCVLKDEDVKVLDASGEVISGCADSADFDPSDEVILAHANSADFEDFEDVMNKGSGLNNKGVKLFDPSNKVIPGHTNLANFEDFEDVRNKDFVLEDKDVSYEVELLPPTPFSPPKLNQKSDTDEMPVEGGDSWNQKSETDEMPVEGGDSQNRMSSFIEESNQIDPEGFELDLEEEYIEFKPQSSILMRVTSQEQKNCWDSDNDYNEEEGQDVLSEHQNLVQQMKRELKNCSRNKNLPTISEEECATPEMVRDLKPLEIERKVEYKDVMEEIHKFYKSYIEKMRKLDILNYQTLHAINFLQLKECDVFNAKRASYKGQRVHADPMHKSIVEMHRDLELVYVGQLCFSWEILCWLYTKVHELLRYDSGRSYNRSAEEFQHFQVLVQRFIEDEPFQGWRIQNYVKSRCTVRHLLQVPMVKDDCLKTKKERREEADAVSLEILIRIIWESMMVFKEFIFADKRSTNTLVKGGQGTEPKAFVDILVSLHKKEKKIKECTQRQNCIVKKVKRNHRQHDFPKRDASTMMCQVDVRLVSRVLRLSRLNEDQLVWCQNKLNNINVVGKKLHVDSSSFLLFPC